jgi:hypothetical protein
MRVAVATATMPPRQATPTRPARRHKPPNQAPVPPWPPIIELTAVRIKAACGVAPGER